MILEELKQTTDQLFDGGLTTNINEGIKKDYERRKEAYSSIRLPRQLDNCRTKYLQDIGFKRVTIPECLKMLSGYNLTKGDRYSGTDIGYYINIREGKWYKEMPRHSCRIWMPTYYLRTLQLTATMFRSAKFNNSHYYEVGFLTRLKTPIPYGVMLRINELKELQLFNFFCAVAPSDAWGKIDTIDPIVLGCVGEIIDDNMDINDFEHFFIAQW